MKEILLYVIAALSSLFVLGYTVHMFIGGLVTPESEKFIIAVTCAVGALVVAALAWDVIRRRRKS